MSSEPTEEVCDVLAECWEVHGSLIQGSYDRALDITYIYKCPGRSGNVSLVTSEAEYCLSITIPSIAQIIVAYLGNLAII